MSTLTTIDLTEDVVYRREIFGAGTGTLSIPGATFFGKDPEDFDRLAVEASAVAESMRLARIASAGRAA